MSNDRIRVNITSNQNSVEVTNTENKVIVTDKKQDTNVNVIQNETSVVTIVSKGPKGDRGEKGEKGEQASLSGSVYITGSLEVSSSVTAQSFTGSLFGTSSWAQNALTSSFITPTGTNAFVQGGNSFGTTALLGTNDNQNLQLETNGSVRMTISSSGRIGIGTTNPALGLLQLSATDENPHANLYINGGNGSTGSITVRVNNGLISNQKTYNPIGGSDSLNFIQLLDTDTTTIANQPIGRIIFTSDDGDTNEFTTKAFIEAVAEDSTPDSFLAFGTNQSGSNTTERMRINSIGNVGIGTTSPTERLHVDGNLLVTGRITAEEFHTEFVSASIIYQSGSTKFGNSSDDTHIFTGSLRIDGSITGSLFGTSSWASNVLTASFITPTGTNAFVQDGNSFGATALLGTNDNQNLQLETSGSVRVHIGNNGNVGIGTTSPISTLTVAGGDININTGYGIGGNNVGSYTPFIRYNNTNAGIVSSSFGHTTAYMLSDAGGLLGTNDISFYAGAVTQTEIMRIVGFTGFVGIGETSPSAKLEIRGSGATSATTAFRVENSNQSASLVVRDDGNVGIGTTSPSVRLHISGTSATNELVYLTGDASQGSAIRFNRGSSYGWRMGVVPNSNFTIEDVSYSTVRFQINNTSGLIGINTTSPNARLHISGANNEALLIASSSTAPSALFVSGSGNVGIGLTSPLAKLHISGASALRLQNAGFDTFQWTFSAGTGIELRNVTDGTNPFYIGGTDNIGIGTTSPSSKLHISGANAIMTLSPIDALPTTNIPSASFATSGSGADLKPYFWNGSTWTALF